MGRSRIITRNTAFALLAGLAACSGGGRTETTAARPSAAPSAASSPAAPAPVVLFVGTSLTAGLGLDPDEAYPAIVAEKIRQAGLDYRVVNAGVSGETSAGALRRIEWLLQQPVAVLVLETGANDGLRGLDTGALRANIQAIVDRSRRQRPPPQIVLVGMEAPPNYGADYARRFRSVYAELARDNDAVLVPFLLEGVAGMVDLNQPDGVHPTAEGHRRMAETVWDALRPLLAREIRNAAR